MMMRVPGYEDPMKVLHRDNEKSQKLQVNQLDTSREAKEILNRLYDWVTGNAEVIGVF